MSTGAEYGSEYYLSGHRGTPDQAAAIVELDCAIGGRPAAP